MFEGLKKRISGSKNKEIENNISDQKTSNKKGLKGMFNKIIW
jgi:hypothetical protein